MTVPSIKVAHGGGLSTGDPSSGCPQPATLGPVSFVLKIP